MNMSTVDTWLGPFTAIVDGDGAVLASGWTADGPALHALIAPSLRGHTLPLPRKDLGAVTKAIEAYHDDDTPAGHARVSPPPLADAFGERWFAGHKER